MRRDRTCQLCKNGTFGANVCGVYIKAAKKDRGTLDAINLLLSAPVWPGASGMEDIYDLVRTVREPVPNAPEWEAH